MVGSGSALTKAGSGSALTTVGSGSALTMIGSCFALTIVGTDSTTFGSSSLITESLLILSASYKK